MQTITVKSIETKFTKADKKPFYVLKDIAGAECTTFDAKLLKLKSNDIIEAEIKTSGKYTNIESWTVTGQAKAEVKPINGEQQITPRYTAEEILAFEEKEARATIKELWLAHELMVEDVEVKGLRQWLQKKLPAPLSLVAEAQKLGAEVIKSPESKLPEFKTGVELFKYAMKHGFSLEKLGKALGTSNPNDIKDIAAAVKVLFPEP